MMRRLIFGCGYLGSRIASLWRSRGDEVFAVTRTSDRADQLAQQGIRPHVADILRPETLANLPAADTVLFAVGYDRSGGTIADVYVAGLANVLAALPGSICRFLYISSTGVYGQTSGEKVDENSVCSPIREGGKACLAAEEKLLNGPFRDKSVILRLAGIYGPGRVPRLAEIAAGKPLALPTEGSLNLIHVDDAAEIITRAADMPLSLPRVFNVADGHPVPRDEYYAEIARQLGAPPPTFVAPDPTAAATLRASSDKRIDVARMMAEIQPKLCYPSYREGLRQILEHS